MGRKRANKAVSENFPMWLPCSMPFYFRLYHLLYKNKTAGSWSWGYQLQSLPESPAAADVVYAVITLYTGQLVFQRKPYYAGVVIALVLTVPVYTDGEAIHKIPAKLRQ